MLSSASATCAFSVVCVCAVRREALQAAVTDTFLELHKKDTLPAARAVERTGQWRERVVRQLSVNCRRTRSDPAAADRRAPESECSGRSQL